jgi:septal ring-binding cell division protein DamX
MAETPEFAAVANLLALLADGKATAKKFDELRQLLEKTAAATAKLEAATAAHDQQIAADRDEMAARERRVRDKEVSLAIKERDLVRREQVLEASKPPRFTAGSNLEPGTISPSLDFRRRQQKLVQSNRCKTGPGRAVAGRPVASVA